MYPVAFQIGDHPISSFGLCLAVGSLIAAWRGNGWLQRAGFPSGYVWHVYGWMMIAGLLGAKIWYALETFVRDGTPIASSLFERHGSVYYGGLIAGGAAVLLKGWIDRVPPLRLLDAFAPVVSLGEALGRIGCFLAGDDYGTPTSLPWGIAFPQGRPPTTELVHPTQLYESAYYLLVTAFLSGRIEKSKSLFGEYLILEGIGRFCVEFIRTNPPTVGPLTLFQVAALVLIAIGTGLLQRSSRAHA